jgi:hypothetical protein
LLCAALLAVAAIAGFVKFHASPAGVAFHAVVLLCACYLASIAVRSGKT